MSRNRNFCFTLNNYTDEEYNNICDLSRQAHYLVVGKEVGENGTPHLQGFIMFNNKKSFDQIKNLINNQRVHIEACLGSPKQNETYCKKDNNFIEFGTPPKGSGARTDLDAVTDLIKSGATMDEIVEQHTGTCIKFYKGIRQVYSHINKQERSWKTTVYWVHGATGTGKTRWIHQLSQNVKTYWKDPSTKWWDGYDSQELVILDDFRPTKELPFSYLLRLFDRYPMSVEAKGLYFPFLAKVIFVTSPVTIREAFAHCDFLKEGDINQMLRRVKEINFNETNTITRYLNLTFNELID